MAIEFKHVRGANPTPALTEMICDLIKLGASPAQACDIKGINFKVLKRWEAEADHPDCPDSHPCAQFVRKVRAARASQRAVLAIEQFKVATQSKDEKLRTDVGWRLLQKIDPDFQEVSKTELSGPNGAPLQIESSTQNLNSLTDDQLLQLYAARKGLHLPAPVDSEYSQPVETIEHTSVDEDVSEGDEK